MTEKLIVPINPLQNGEDTLITTRQWKPTDPNNPEDEGTWIDATIYMVVNAETGAEIDNGYRSFEEAARAWPEAINAKGSPQPLDEPDEPAGRWVNTRGLDAETIVEITREMYVISGMFEDSRAFTEFILECVKSFQDQNSGFDSWDDFEPHPFEAERGVVDYLTAIMDFCHNTIEDMRVQGSMP